MQVILDPKKQGEFLAGAIFILTAAIIMHNLMAG